MVKTNQLYYGDNLDVLRRHIDDETADLIYLDPPFNSNRDYNVLFQERDTKKSHAQVQAFEDTWQWDQESSKMYHEVIQEGGSVADTLSGLKESIGYSDMLAYLSMMAPRLKELHRVLKDTGTLWLHCDPTASHYLKILLDSVFGPENMLNEIVWKRSYAHAKGGMGRCGRVHDIILVYKKKDGHKWNTVYTDYDDEYIENKYSKKDEDGRRFQDVTLTANNPGSEYEWHIKSKNGSDWQADLNEEYKNPKPNWEYETIESSDGRYWSHSKENMVELEKNGKIYYTRTGTPRKKKYVDEMEGVQIQDVWTDIPPINSQADERLGYPTQKPEELLERILKAGTNKGDVVLDPFCGCGTTVHAAEKLNRKWVGIDITHLAISLLKHRLQTAFGEEIEYEVRGEPVNISGAKQLAEDDPHQFEWWALGLVGARPSKEEKGPDQGIDGRLYFSPDKSEAVSAEEILFSVKSGNTGPSHVRDLAGTVHREEAVMGVLITLQDPTDNMEQEAASHGRYDSAELGNQSYPKIQIITVGDLLDGSNIDAPIHIQQGGNITLRPHAAPEAQKKNEDKSNQSELFDH
jgi:DNA modification methylase